MYFPKNKIKTGLYSNGGEFIYEDNQSPFSGYYYSLYDGTFFEGKSPVKNNRKLTKSTNPNISISFDPLPPTVSDSGSVLNKDFRLDTSVSSLQNKALIIPTGQIQNLPTSYYPKPSPFDYSIGQFLRYFCRKTNENVFLEINQNDYASLYNQNKNYVYSLYIPFKTYWLISGDYNKAIETNFKLVQSIEKDLQVYGFSKFIEKTGGYNKFYF
jgi:hypothetical protein